MNLSQCKAILFFGGGFDPPTVAHTQLPPLAAQMIHADCVLYVPSGKPPHKSPHVASDTDRVAMLRLALESAHLPIRWHIWEDEIEQARQGHVSYTLRSLERLREQAGPGPVFRLLIGADQFESFHTWREPDRVIALAQPLVMVRPPRTMQDVLAHLPPGYNAKEWRPRLVEVASLDVSSTDIRHRIRTGQPLNGLVAPKVAAYIREHGLYRAQ